MKAFFKNVKDRKDEDDFKFDEEETKRVCFEVAKSAWKYLKKQVDFYGVDEFDKYKTIVSSWDILPSFLNMGEVQERTTPHYLSNRDSKVIPLKSLELEENVYLYYSKMLKHFYKTQQASMVARYQYPFPWTFLAFSKSPNYWGTEKIPENRKNCLTFSRLMQSYGLMALGQTYDSILPCETGDLMLFPDWEKYIDPSIEKALIKDEKREKKEKSDKKDTKLENLTLDLIEKLRCLKNTESSLPEKEVIEDKLKILREKGFEDDRFNLIMLQLVNYNVEECLSDLKKYYNM